MVTPFVVLFAVFFVLPLVYSVYTSFESPLTRRVSGLANYRFLWHDSQYWQGLLRVACFGVVQVTVMIVLALVLALFLDSPYCRGKRIFGTIYFLPYAIPGVIAAIMWGFLFTPQLDSILGVPRDLGLTRSAVNPLGSGLVLYAIMFIVTWEFTGYNMTIYLTSLSSIPAQILDAARIDGASELQIARRIKLPLLRRTIVFTLVLSIIGTLQLFNEPSIVGRITSIPTGYTPNLLIYTTAFTYNNIPLAAAESVVLAVITILGSLAFFGLTRSRVKERSVRRPRRSTLAAAKPIEGIRAGVSVPVRSTVR
jgi:multiple sugar transport system permease protein